MERNRQGTNPLALVLAHPGVAGLARPGVCRLAGPGGGKVHFVIRCFKTRLRRHPFALPFPHAPAPRRCCVVPRAWCCMARYGHGVTHATVTHSEGHLGSGLTSRGLHTEEHHQLTTLAHPPGRANLQRHGRDPGILGTNHDHWILPWGEWRRLERSRQRDFFHRKHALGRHVSPSGRTAGSHSSPISKTKTPASGLRQALLGRIRFGKQPSLG